MEIQDLKQWLKERRITEVECLVPDMTGNARGKIIPADKFLADEGMRLPEQIFIQTVTGDWPDDCSMVHPGDIDMFARPDPASARIVPWAEDATAQIIHDCYGRDGELYPLAPRTVLRRILALYMREGWTPVIAPEVEFFLVQKNTDPDFPLLPPIGRSGRSETARQSYSIDAVNEFDPLFEDMYDFCEAMELDVDTLIHESGAAQMEVNFRHGDPMELADQVFLFKRTMREVALRHGVYATFLAKPMATEPGSAMHMHQSLLDKDGRNVFADEQGGMTDLFRHFIGGLQKYTPAAMAFFAPNVNSYRRFAKELAAPINLHWGWDNRTAGLRVPFSDPADMRVENRLAGADVNPYLAMAASLACGYLGMKQRIEPTEPLETNAYEKPFGLTRNIEESLDLLRASTELQTLMGADFVKAYAGIKAKEYETFFR
ncbi:MAG TPA: glutamine synthetase family protein, partial [Spongiibacteraceae bacterium]|nr:glutamine synthetase family protein [Spongiibacteraceae bacterium]